MKSNRTKRYSSDAMIREGIVSKKSVNFIIIIKLRFLSRTNCRQYIFILKRGLRAR